MSESSKGPIFGLFWFGLPSQRYSVRVPKSHGEVEIKAVAVCPPQVYLEICYCYFSVLSNFFLIYELRGAHT